MLEVLCFWQLVVALCSSTSSPVCCKQVFMSLKFVWCSGDRLWTWSWCVVLWGWQDQSWAVTQTKLHRDWVTVSWMCGSGTSWVKAHDFVQTDIIWTEQTFTVTQGLTGQFLVDKGQRSKLHLRRVFFFFFSVRTRGVPSKAPQDLMRLRFGVLRFDYSMVVANIIITIITIMMVTIFNASSLSCVFTLS